MGKRYTHGTTLSSLEADADPLRTAADGDVASTILRLVLAALGIARTPEADLDQPREPEEHRAVAKLVGRHLTGGARRASDVEAQPPTASRRGDDCLHQRAARSEPRRDRPCALQTTSSLCSIRPMPI